MNHEEFLQVTCDEAKQGLDEGGIGIGAVLVKNGQIIARSHDRTRQHNNPIAVAEVDCIKLAGRRGDQQQLTLYSSRYPDLLTAGTVLQFSIGSMVIGLDEKINPAISLLLSRNVPIIFKPFAACEHLAT